MSLRLYNTLTRTKQEFVPIDPANVRLYVCGPTVYDFAHIGNARPVIVFDVLFRLLKHLYGDDHVTYVRNVTDVDDKINARAARDFPELPLNEAIRRVTETTNAQYQSDVKALGCLEPSFQPRATDYVDRMREMIERLLEVGVAYVADGHVLFSPSAMNGLAGPRYGALAGRSPDEMLAGARVEVASYKRDEMDFVLWKPSARDEPGWPSPAGIAGLGRPGWHIECSAMSMAKLLEPFGGGLKSKEAGKNVFDIHGGGIDLVFPHHENEIAQSCSALGTERMANYWMHNGFLQVEGRKMAKSEGNFVTIRELLEEERFGGRRWPGEVLRLAMLMTHYREPIDFSLRKLEEASQTWLRWGRIQRQAGDRNWLRVNELVSASKPAPGIESLLLDDLNTAGAVNSMQALARAAESGDADAGEELITSAAFLGIDLRDAVVEVSGAQEAMVQDAIESRLALIREKNWPEADRIRDELFRQGIQLKDGKDPATGERVTTWEVKR